MASPLPGVKEPHLAGRSYPAAPDALRALVGELLAGVDVLPGVIAAVAPHAPYAQSGAVAARALGAAGPRRRVVILAGCHHATLKGAATLPMRAYRTPLGELPIDAD